MPTTRTPLRRVPLQTLQQRASTLLREAGVAPDHAAAVAAVLVDADARGHRSHGVALVPTYLARIERGGIDPRAEPAWRTEANAVAVLDAHAGLGPIAAGIAAERCAELAAHSGIAAVAVTENNHIGMLAAYRRPFLRHDVIGLIFNQSGPSVAPPGARRATIGNNALCLIAPRQGAPPFIVDFATGTVACGKIRQAALEQRTIPRGWLLDHVGHPTTDAEQLDRGGSVPVFGGHKGLGVTLIVDLLVGTLATSRSSARVHRQRAEPEEPMHAGQLFIGVAPSSFGGPDPAVIAAELEAAVRSGYGAEPQRPWFPEQREEDCERDSAEHGVTIAPELAQQLRLHEGLQRA